MLSNNFWIECHSEDHPLSFHIVVSFRTEQSGVKNLVYIKLVLLRSFATLWMTKCFSALVAPKLIQDSQRIQLSQSHCTHCTDIINR